VSRSRGFSENKLDNDIVGDARVVPSGFSVIASGVAEIETGAQFFMDASSAEEKSAQIS